MNKLFFLALSLFTFYSCRARNDDSQADLKWGHLNVENLQPTSPQFLINKTRGVNFKVCLAKYLRDQFPGIEQEIDASVNIWASYIGRKIPVTIETKDLPRAKAGDDVNDFAKTYFTQCGKGYDIVIGFGPLQGQTVGLTGDFSSYIVNSDGSKKIVSFERFLFLRDFDANPSTNTLSSNAWKSFGQKSGTVPQDGQLLPLMRQRQTKFYSLKNDLLTLSVLAHEMGHVWGLCDQYEGTANCDKQNSSSHIEMDSLMGAARFRQIAYLTDDDIEGIRALAARPGFKHDWPDAPGLTAVTAPVNLGLVEFLAVQSLERKDNTLIMNFGILSHVATKLSISLVPSNGGADRPLSNDMMSDEKGFDQPMTTFTIHLSPSDTSSYNVRLQAFTKDANGNWMRQKSVVTTNPK